MTALIQESTRADPNEEETLCLVRGVVRSLLLSSAAFQKLEPDDRKALAESMVKVCHTAAELIRDEIKTADRLTPSGPALARAQSAGQKFSGVAADRVAGTTRAILNAVSFPRFVTELITGVFRAIVDSSQEQMRSYVELLQNVAASTDGFAENTMSDNQARSWLANRFPGSFEVIQEEGFDEGTTESVLQLREGASPPSQPAVRAALGLGEDDPVSTDPERLVPIARIAIARQRQQMLATMVMLGMQRIVIESGRINASMRFHIDTRSAAQEDDASRFELQNEIAASGRYGFGPWGVSASIKNNIAYVSTQKTQTTEEMNTDLELNSSVELYFKSDYLPLDRLAGGGQQDRIRANTLNPDTEAKIASDARSARHKAAAQNEAARRTEQESALKSTVAPKPPKEGDPGTQKDADAAQKEGEKLAKDKKAEPKKTEPAKNPAASSAPAGGERATETSSQSPPPPATTRRAATPQSLAHVHKSNDFAPQDGTTSRPRAPDVIFSPSPMEAVNEMLALAQVRPTDFVYDLGCGDGRIVIAAAKMHGCRAIGFEINPEHVATARQNVQNYGVQNLVEIREESIFDVDLSQADVVFAYLLPQLNVRLLQQFERMKPGARIVSEDFDMQGVIPDRVVQVFLPQYNFYKTFYLWTLPLKRTETPARHQWSNAKGIKNQTESLVSA